MPHALVLRHLAFETLDGFAAPFLRQGLAIHTLDAWSPQAPEAAAAADVLVLLGGPISVNDVAQYPHLPALLELTARRIDAGQPLLGLCLGAQLIARALGAVVEAAAEPEIGVAPIELTPEGHESCLETYADEPLAWHWHGEQFALPTGATALARSALCAQQAFAIERHVLACQFHPEFSGEVEPWLVGHTCELARHGIAPQGLREAVNRWGTEPARKAERVATRWLGDLGLTQPR